MTFFRIILITFALLSSGLTLHAAPPAAAPAKQQKAPAKKAKGKAKTPKETSGSVQKQQQAITREISDTQKKIASNDAAVSVNLATLESLGHDVAVQKEKVTGLQHKEKQLVGSIDACNNNIAQGEERLAIMREQYIRAIKKMRAARKRLSPMAFIFSSKNFYQALRRLRYLQKFSEWRTRREAQIKNQIAELDRQRSLLAKNKQSLQTTLTQQVEAQNVLAAKEQQQAAVVSKLRADGDALRQHLARKQAEANALKSRIAELIAKEQAEAAAAEQRRKEQAARAAAEKAAKEKAAAEKAAKEKAAKEKAAAEKAAKERQIAQANQPKKETPKKETPKKETPQKSASEQANDKRYAEARNRKPRTEKKETPKAEQPKPAKPAEQPKPAKPAEATKPAATSASGFAAAKGSLPHPASGSFKIVSRFGRHPLPELPEVMYDNPGIDAVVSSGASAQAVYAGTVTGVYALPGYSTVVIISHGEYYTVYGNIGNPAVKKGDSVKAGQNLGKLVADPDEGGRTTIHFEVWRNREKQNPEAWIR